MRQTRPAARTHPSARPPRRRTSATIVLLVLVFSMLASACEFDDQLRVSALTPAEVVEPGSSVSLASIASGGTPPYSFRWTQTGGAAVTLSDPTAQVPQFVVPDVVDTFSFTVSVTDASGADATGSVSLRSDVVAPLTVAASGPDGPVEPGQTAALAASVAGGQALFTFAWSQTSGPAVTIADPTSASTSFVMPVADEDLGFAVTVTDTRGVTASADVVVTPTAPAPLEVTAGGPTGVVPAGQTAALTSAVTGGRAPYSYAWAQTAGLPVSLSDPAAADPSFVVPEGGGTFAFTLTVTDALGSTVSSPVTVAGPGPSCGPSFQALWDAARDGSLFPADLGPLGAVTAGSASTGTTCDPAVGFAITGGSVELLEGTLSGTDLAGRVTPTGLCLDSGALVVRSGLGPIAVTLDSENGLCLPIGDLLAAADSVDAAGFLTVDGFTAVAGTATITVDGTGAHVVAAGVPATGGTAHAELDIDLEGNVTGSAALAQVPVFGTPVDLAGTVSAPVDGPLTGSLRAAVAGPIDVAPGVRLAAVDVTLADGALAVSGDARLGGELGAALSFAGVHTDADDWSVELSSSGARTWTLTPGVELEGTMSGTLASTAGAIDIDIDLAVGSTASALATWDLGGGTAVMVQTARLGNAEPPAWCAPTVGAGQIWASLEGGLSLPAPSGDAVAVPVAACVDTSTGAFLVSAEATGPIEISEQVALGADLALQISGDGSGAVTGSGHATVTFTVAGEPQSVVAEVELTAAGALVVGATVDLADWDLGSGAGHVWFASAPVAGFDTEDPALGTIDLPAGLTVGVVFEIPEAAYVTLRDVVGLALTSRTVPVVASVTTDGSFVATASLPVDPDHQLVAGVPGGLQFGTAVVTFTTDEVRVVLDGAAGTGTAQADLLVAADGSVTGSLDLRDVAVFGHPVSVLGSLSAPAGGPLTGSLAGRLAGPIAVTSGVELSDIGFSIATDAGLTLTATAEVAGFTVEVTGSYTDADRWAFTVTSGDANGHSPVDGLVLTGDLSGSVVSDAGLVTFDVVAGNAGDPVAAWDLGAGHAADLDEVRVTNTAVPASCRLPLSPGDVWVRAQGGLTLVNPAGDPVEVPVQACIHAGTGAFSISGDATGEIAVSDQVSLGDDLALEILGDGNGTVTGSGHATVTITVDGAPQSVVADLALRADGTLVIGATVDLGQWELGTGSGHVWFASAAVAGFDTGDAAIGTIDLPAGLTAGIAFEIPAEAHAALRDLVGLELVGPTITVVASLTTDGSFTATATVPVDPDHQLVPGVPGGLRFETASVTFTDGAVRVVLDGTAGSGTADADLLVATDGSVTATLDLEQVPVFGQPLDLAGTLSAPAGGPLTGSLTADLPGPITVADGVVLSDLHVALGSAGFAVDGTATVAGFTVEVAGTYADAGTWALTVTSGTASGLEPIDGLTVDGTLTGTVTSVADVVTFDLTVGNAGSPVASWDLGAGHAASLDQVRVANAAAPTDCVIAIPSGDVWLQAAGRLTLTNPLGEPVAVPVGSCIDVGTGAFSVTGRATGPVAVSDQVSLGADLSLQILGDGTGVVTGTGEATVVFTVNGSPQSVHADVELRADGTLVIGATVDLAQWGLGEGTGHVWFATAAVADFDTENPAIGTIDLAAGLTAGIAVTIPQSAYDALTNVVGLELASTTVTLVASIDGTGSFSATLTVPTRPQSQLATGVPGGLHLDDATLQITSAGFTVDVSGTTGSGVDEGTVAVHLGVQADGAIDGSIDLHGITVLGQPLDLTGTLVAPAGGNLAVTVTADLPGPIEVAEGFVLSNLHVRLDPSGTFVQGDARIAGAAGPLVQVEGLITDDRTWAVQVSSDAAPWTVVDGLTLDAAFAGTLRSTNGVVTFDLTGGSPSDALATWDLGNGSAVTLVLARVADVPAPPTCAVPVNPGDVWISADGSLSLGIAGGSAVNLPIKACVNATTGAFTISARSAQPIPLGRQVMLGEDLSLDVTGDGHGNVTGSGHATVTFTVDGTAQDVVADIELRADGTLVIGATVDLAPWGLGEGSGHVWFASGPVTGFDTDDPAIGVIDLAAGLTAGVAVTLPPAAYRTLTEVVGLDLASPTIVVIGSVGLSGELTATATVRTDPGHQLIDGVPGGIRLDSATVTVTAEGITVDLDGAAGSDGTVSAHLTVTDGGSVSGRLELHQLPVFGHRVDLVGDVSAPVAGELTGSLVAGVPGPVAVAPGVNLHDIHLSLDPTGLVVAADAVIGTAGATLLHVSGTVVDERNWSLEVDADDRAGWTIVPGLTVDATLTASISSVDGVVSFDASAGGGSAPVASWDLGGGNGVALTSIRATNTAVSASCPVTVPAGDVWVEADGRITLAGVTPIELPVHACVNVSTGAFSIDAASAAPIVIGDQISLRDDLALSISGDGDGTITGNGHATIDLTVDGETQSVVADLALRGDGTFIIGATVDLAQWDLGDGLGHAWFATARAAGFETGDPAIGTIDLPAGLTVAVSYEIPETAYRTLTETLGLDLASPTLTVVASVTADGSFEAVATVATKPGSELLPGVPGGLRLGRADLTFGDAGVTVDLVGTAGTDGTAEAHLTVSTEGAVSGTLDLRQVPVFDQSLDLAGSLEAPAGGPLTGALTASLAGPVVVSEQLSLFGLTVTLDHQGVAVEGTARLGGSYGPTVHVEGSFTDTDNWSFTVSTDTQQAWTVLPGVTVNGDLTGTVSSVAGLVTFDVIAGAGSGGSTEALAHWDLGNGNAVELTTARIANTVAPASCGAEVGIGDVWVRADGRLSLQSSSGALDVPVHTCIDVTTGAFLVTANTSAAIALADSVRLEPGLALAIRGDGYGGIVGAGAGTVTFTVEGEPQSVDATIDLYSDGSLIIGASIDLAEWGLGQGAGHVWFATDDVAAFDTGDPALGTVKLLAGLTVGISFELPDALYETLTDDLGLVVPSRSIAVVASVTDDGSFRATASLAGTNDGTGDLLGGIPGGVRIERADVVFTDLGVTVDALAYTGTWGQVDLHLEVATDGSMAGHVLVRDVVVFGTYVDLEGDVSAPADGPLTGSITAELPGPLWVGQDVELRDVRIAYDPTGLKASGTAMLGRVEDDGAGGTDEDRVTVQVDGTYVDWANWSLTVTSADGTGYRITPSLTIHATFTGEISSVDGVVTFDVTAGNAGQPLVDWDLNGNHVKLQTARISNRLMASSCGLADEWYYDEGDIWVEADGLLTIALPGAPTVDAPVHACVDVSTSAFLVHAETADAIEISEQVSIDPGLSLTLHGEPVQEHDGGPWRQAIWGEGSAAATFTVNGAPQSIAVHVEVDRQGTLVVGGAIDLAGWGLGDGVGHVWYASAPVPNHDGGPGWGSVPLSDGLTVAVAIPIPAGASHALRSSMGLPVPDGTLTAVGRVGSDGSFDATITLKDIDLGVLFRTPGGATLTEAVLQITGDGIVLDGHGTIGDDLGSGAGTFTMHVDVTDAGVFSGSVELQDLRVLGQELDFSAVIDMQDGWFHFRAEADLPGSIPVLDGAFSVSGVHVVMDSHIGFDMAADVRIPVPGDEEVVARLTGQVTDDRNWAVGGLVDLPAWTPFPDLTIDATVRVMVGLYDGRSEWEITVDDVLQWRPMDALLVNFDQLTISNAGSPYWTCNGLVEPGHVWLYGLASAHLQLKGPDHHSAGAEGCFDLTDQDLELRIQKTDMYPWDLGAVDVFSFNVDLRYEGETGLFTFGGGAFGWINLNGDIVVASIDVEFDSNGKVLLAARADLSQLVDARADALVYYSSVPRPAFDTGDPEYGVIDLPQGVSVFVRIGLPEHINDTLKTELGVDLTGTELWASASIGADGAFRLRVEVQLPGEGAQVFTTSDDPAKATWLRLQELHVAIDTAGTRRVEIGAGGLLHFPAMPGSVASDLPVEANLTVNLDTGDVAVGISTEGAVWHDAFGIRGLDLTRFGVSGGISGGWPQLGLVATAEGLPQDWAEAIGYQQGQVVSVAFNISLASPMIEIQLGAPGNTTPVLLPGSASGNPDAFQVHHARLYVVPFATSIGGIDFPAGISLDLHGQVQGRPLSITASLDPGAKRLYAEAIVPEIRFGNALIIRNLYVKMDFSPTAMVFQLRGSATFGKINVIVDVAVGNGSSQIDIRTVDAIPGITGDLDTTGTIAPGGQLSGSGDTQVQVGNILKDATVEMTDDGLLVRVPDFNGWEATATLSMSGLDLTLHQGFETDPFFLGVFEVGGGAAVDVHVVITGDGWYASGQAHVYVFAASVIDGWKRHYVDIWGIGLKVGSSEICAMHPMVPWPICFPTGDNPLDQGDGLAPRTTVAVSSPDAPSIPSIAPDRADGTAFVVVPERAVARTDDGHLTLDGAPVDETVVVVVPDEQFAALTGA